MHITYLTLKVTTGLHWAWPISVKTYPGRYSARNGVTMFQNYLFPYLTTRMGNDKQLTSQVKFIFFGTSIKTHPNNV